jgi:hypothetical protein
MEVDMKRVLEFVLLMIALTACATPAPETSGMGAVGISARDVAGTPDVFCKVTKEPDPALMGGWKCVHRRYNMRTHQYVDEHVEYWLIKSGDRYGFFFFRVKPEEKTYRGWRDVSINGNTISSRAGFKVFAQDGEVFYSWEGDKPTKMTRIEGN